MNFGKIKIDKADQTLSLFIRLRDKKCCRCGSPVEMNEKGLPKSHHNSHYFGRGNECTRFDPENCDTLCCGCHEIWGSNDKEGYREFKIKQLGEDGFLKLRQRFSMCCKKDRLMSLIIAKKLLELEICKT